jgi:alpha-mannosidase
LGLAALKDRSGETAGEAEPVEELLSLSPPGVRMTAFKRSLDGDASVIRIHETTGLDRCAILRLEGKCPEIKINLKPFEIKTLCIEKTGTWREVDPCREV